MMIMTWAKYSKSEEMWNTNRLQRRGMQQHNVSLWFAATHICRLTPANTISTCAAETHSRYRTTRSSAYPHYVQWNAEEHKHSVTINSQLKSIFKEQLTADQNALLLDQMFLTRNINHRHPVGWAKNWLARSQCLWPLPSINISIIT